MHIDPRRNQYPLADPDEEGGGCDHPCPLKFSEIEISNKNAIKQNQKKKTEPKQNKNKGKEKERESV